MASARPNLCSWEVPGNESSMGPTVGLSASPGIAESI